MTLTDASCTSFAREVAALIVDGLSLEGLNPAEMALDIPLFGEGLGLDSLDLLEISLLIQQSYGVKLKAGDPGNASIFTSLQSLADHVEGARATQRG